MLNVALLSKAGPTWGFSTSSTGFSSWSLGPSPSSSSRSSSLPRATSTRYLGRRSASSCRSGLTYWGSNTASLVFRQSASAQSSTCTWTIRFVKEGVFEKMMGRVCVCVSPFLKVHFASGSPSCVRYLSKWAHDNIWKVREAPWHIIFKYCRIVFLL